MTEKTTQNILLHPIFQVLHTVAAHHNTHIYAVGGYVRDALLHRPCKDIDVLVLSSGIDFAHHVAQALPHKPQVAYFKNFGTAMIQYHDLTIEFVGARKESYDRQSRKPIVENGTLYDDLARRDFTINAMAANIYPNFGEMIDMYNGSTDLQNQRLTTPLEPNLTFSDDPLRMMRAIRFATQLGFFIDENTYNAIKTNAERIKIVSAERITDELNKIMLAQRPSVGFKLLFDTGLLKIIFPEIHHLQGVKVMNGKAHKDNFYHTLEVLDNTAQTTPPLHPTNLWLRWAALLHDVAKPATQRYEPEHGWTFHGHEDLGARWIPKIFAKLKLPLDDKMKYVQKLVRLHLRPIALVKSEVTDSAIRRLLFEAGNDIDDLMILCSADITTKKELQAARYRNNVLLVAQKIKEIEAKDHLRNWQPPITGEDIMHALNIPPSKHVGIIKDYIREAILDGLIPNQRTQAIALMTQKAAELNLKIINQIL
jgi:putative nucleotidyltransferase with HDIG domain